MESPSDATKSEYQLFASPGCGSVTSEALLVLANLPHRIEYLPFDSLGPQNERLRALNPLGQVPTLLLPDGTVMTESAAIALLIAARVPAARLAPAADDPGFPVFLRWLVFLTASLYSTFTYADFPARFVTDHDAQKELKQRVRERRQQLWIQLESALDPDPWTLGSRFSALDVFVSVMTRWTPRRDWFAHNCPKLYRLALQVDENPRLKIVWSRNFDTG